MSHEKLILPARRIITLDDIFRLDGAPRIHTANDLYQEAWQRTAGLAFEQDFLSDWSKYRFKNRDKITSVEDAVRLINEAIQEAMDDPYTRVMDASKFSKHEDERQGTLRGIGVVFDEDDDAEGHPVISRVLEKGPAHKGGLLAGDAIVKVDGKPTAKLNREELVKLIAGDEGTTVKITVKRDGAEKTLDIVRGIVNVPTVRAERFGDVVFIKLSAFMQDDATEEMAEALREHQDAKAIILGLRYNPGGQVMNAIRIASLFLDEGEVVSIHQRVPFAGYTKTTYTLTPNSLIRLTVDSDSNQVIKRQLLPRDPNLSGGKPVFVLVDEHSASASEMLSGALKDLGRATLVGKTTYGKGIGQSVIPMMFETALVVTSLRYYSPSGFWAGDAHKNRIGIAPHHEVSLPEGKFPMPGKEHDTQFNFALDLARKAI